MVGLATKCQEYTNGVCAERKYTFVMYQCSTVKEGMITGQEDSKRGKVPTSSVYNCCSAQHRKLCFTVESTQTRRSRKVSPLHLHAIFLDPYRPRTLTSKTTTVQLQDMSDHSTGIYTCRRVTGAIELSQTSK
jgi:hypothetical protein